MVIKKIISLGLLLGLLVFTKPSLAQSMTTVGQCHSTNLLGRSDVTWAYDASDASIWSKIEPQRGQFNFTKMDQIVNNARSLGKKVWIQVLTDNPGIQTIPDWALAACMHQFPDRYDPGLFKKDRPVQWDPLYLQFLQEVLTAMANKYDNDNAVEAVLMMSGGHYGEMALHVKQYKWDPNPDVRDPNNAYIKEMARVTGETPQAITQPYNEYFAKFDYYYVENTKKLVDMYAQTFKNKAVVLQGGSGMSGDFNINKYVIDYAVSKYGNHVWLKQNGWGNWGGGDAYSSLFSQYKDRTRVTREVGHYVLWQNAQQHNTDSLNSAYGSGASALCFQQDFFVNNSIYPGVNFTDIKNRLEQNYQNYFARTPTIPLPPHYPTFTPVPTSPSCQIPTSPPTPSGEATRTPTPTQGHLSPTNTPIPTRLPTPTIDTRCVCQSDNTCHQFCTFDKFADISYASPIKCSREAGVSGNPPDQNDKDSYCQAPRRTMGDADSSYEVDEDDYLYYLRAVLRAPVPSYVNPDFNGDGLISAADLNIFKKKFLNL